MRRLIKADLGRILKKPTFYILPLIYMIMFLFGGNAETASDQIDSMQNQIGIGLFMMSIALFLSIYGDEFRTGTMQIAIGRGLSRRKIISAKLLEFVMGFLVVVVVTYLIALCENLRPELAVSRKQNLFLLLYMFFAVIKYMVFVVIATFVLFATWNVAAGMLTLIAVSLLAENILMLLQSKFNIPVADNFSSGLIDRSFASFKAGEFGWQIIPVLVIYIGGIIYLTMVIFDRKELEL